MSSANGNEPNALVHSTSPYLLQHAYNPVHWQPWGKEAFAQAKEKDKPILVSIGYSACHWCHVMERESFEDQSVADYMNKHFICIKVDREEHPDVDHLYMNACQLMTGAGGWPLNMFLTPDLKPFTGGTYYPPEARYGRTSWLDALTFVVDIWSNRTEEVLAQANQVAEQISRSNLRMLSLAIPAGKKEGPKASLVAEKLAASFDTSNGGFGDAPKFPSSMTLLYMLKSSWFTKDERMSDQVHLTLQHMLRGGIYDHVAGGISRYTVDAAWLVPHFEKMLYDNALMVNLLAEAYGRYQLTEYKQKMEETISFVLEEMTSDEGGFYSAYDADSEGVEGKYYTWSQEEVRAVLGKDADWFMGLMDVTQEGNWEGRNILHMNHTGATFPLEKQRLQDALSALKKARTQRVKPQLDDKVILFWNALMSDGLISAYKVTGNEAYLEVAKRNVDFILEAFFRDEQLLHVRTKGQSHIAANLEDYAACIQVLISIFGETGDVRYWEKAMVLMQQTELRFRDQDNGFFRFGDRNENHLPVDTIELFDHAVPSGNAIMAMNYQRIHTVTGEQSYLEAYERMAAAMTPAIQKYPASFGYWLNALLPLQFEQAEIVVSGPDARKTMQSIHQLWYPLKFSIIICDNTLENLLLAADRYNINVTSIYLCKNQQCAAPVKQVSEFKEQLFGL